MSWSDFKRWVKGLRAREQGLMLLFFFTLALLWFFSSWDNLQESLARQTTLRAESSIQALWLDRETRILEGLAEVRSQIVPDRTFNPSALAGRVDQIARQSGSPFSAEPVRTREGQAFLTHTQRLTFQGATLDQLIGFEESLLAERPYLSIEEVRILPRSNRLQLDATFIVTAIELR